MRFKTVVLQWKSCRLPHVSLSYTTHAFKCNDTHTQTYMKPAHAHTKHTKNDKDTQVTHSLLTPWLEACRRTGLTTHTHPALPTSVTLLFLYRAHSGRGKKNWKTPCWLWFSGVTSPTQNVLVTPESTLCQPVPFWDCTHTQAAISGCWKPAFSSKVKPRDGLSKHLRTRAVESLRLSDPAATGVPESCQSGRVRFRFSHQKV